MRLAFAVLLALAMSAMPAAAAYKLCLRAAPGTYQVYVSGNVHMIPVVAIVGCVDGATASGPLQVAPTADLGPIPCGFTVPPGHTYEVSAVLSRSGSGNYSCTSLQ